MVRKKALHGADGTAQDFHKTREAKEAKRNAEMRDEQRKLNELIYRPDRIRAEIARIKGDAKASEADLAQLKALQQALANAERRDAERDRHLEHQSEVAKKRKIAAGRHSGPPPPDGPPPRYGPGLPPPPAPPPPREYRRPPPPPAPVAFSYATPAAAAAVVLPVAAVPEPPPVSTNRPPMTTVPPPPRFMPTQVVFKRP